MEMLLFAQADIAPLMASLIGVPFPLNSVVRSTNVFSYYRDLLAKRCWRHHLRCVRGKVINLENCCKLWRLLLVLALGICLQFGA